MRRGVEGKLELKEIGGDVFLLPTPRMELTEYPRRGFGRSEKPFEAEFKEERLATTVRMMDAPIEVDVEPVTVEETTVRRSPSRIVAGRRVERTADTADDSDSEVPLEPPTEENWRVTIRRPSAAERVEPRAPRSRVPLAVLVLILIVAAAVAGAYFAGLPPFAGASGGRGSDVRGGPARPGGGAGGRPPAGHDSRFERAFRERFRRLLGE